MSAPTLSGTPARTPTEARALAITIVVAAVVGAAAAILDPTRVRGLIALGLGLGAVLLIATRPPYRPIGAMLVGAFVARAALGYVDAYHGPLPGADVDAKGMESLAVVLAEQLRSGILPNPIALGARLYSSVLAIPYAILGPSLWMGDLLSALLGVVLLVRAYQIAALLHAHARGRLLVLALALYPSYLLFTSITHREALIYVLFSSVVLHVVRWYLFTQRASLALVAAYLVPLIVINAGFLVVPVAAGIPAGLSVGRSTPRQRALAVLLGVALVAGFFATSLGLNKITRLMSTDLQDIPEVVADIRSRKARGQTQIAIATSLGSWVDVVWDTPSVVASMLLAPYPWDAFGSSQRLVDMPKALDALTLAAGVILLVVWFRRAYRAASATQRQALAAMLCILVLGLVTFAWGSATTGIIFRHRTKFTWLLFTVVAVVSMPRRPR